MADENPRSYRSYRSCADSLTFEDNNVIEEDSTIINEDVSSSSNITNGPIRYGNSDEPLDLEELRAQAESEQIEQYCYENDNDDDSSGTLIGEGVVVEEQKEEQKSRWEYSQRDLDLEEQKRRVAIIQSAEGYPCVYCLGFESKHEDEYQKHVLTKHPNHLPRPTDEDLELTGGRIRRQSGRGSSGK
jgi:hypothetical protein